MTIQQQAWAGKFGDDYHTRNEQVDHLEFWREVLGPRGTSDIRSALEVGAGQGDNLAALRRLREQQYPQLTPLRVTGIDVNTNACLVMQARGIVGIRGGFPDMKIDNLYDLVLTRGFLIHVPGAHLDATLEKIYQLSNRYICFAEYYSPARRRVSYRGNQNMMWTGDYAGMLMKMHPDLKLLRYGFKYWQDNGYDITYFLMEKPQ